MDIIHRKIQKNDAKRLADFYTRNSKHLIPWEPLRAPGFHSVENWSMRVNQRVTEQNQNIALYFLALDSKETKVLATCSLTQICYGAFRACYMGYSVDKLHEGKGVMKGLCRHTLEHAFRHLQLNRVMANYMPKNVRSGALLEQLGFTIEGEAKKYLFINGKWEDHILTSRTNPEKISM